MAKERAQHYALAKTLGYGSKGAVSAVHARACPCRVPRCSPQVSRTDRVEAAERNLSRPSAGDTELIRATLQAHNQVH